MEDNLTPTPENVPAAIPEETQEQSFKEMLDKSMTSLHPGKIVRGEVVRVTPTEVIVDLGHKSDGIITKNEFTDDQSQDLQEIARPGDLFDVLVMRVNDGEGNVQVSKKRVDNQANYRQLEEAFNEKTTLPGKITDVVNGGLIANIKGCRAFVPASQISGRFEQSLEIFKGKELNFKILEFDRAKRRIVAGRKEIAVQESKQKRDEVFATIELGQIVDGIVSRLVDFGAFIDIGGVDGLIHVSEVSWKRIRRPSDVLTVGQEVKATVIGIDPEKSKISLSLKDQSANPWVNIHEKYPIGDIVQGKVARLASFGAFISLEEGLDGLVHISQIADRHITKPDEELSVGQIIQVKVIDVNTETQRISLSKREADLILYPDDYYEDEYVTGSEPTQEASEETAIPETEEAPAVPEIEEAPAVPETEEAPAVHPEPAQEPVAELDNQHAEQQE